VSMAAAVGVHSVYKRISFARSLKLAGAAVILLGLTGYSSLQTGGLPSAKTLKVAGVQMEFPNVTDIVSALDKLLAAQPSAELFILSEYTLDGPVPDSLKEWCRQHG